MDFETAFDKLMEHEGFYSDNPSDPGRKTTWGVTEAVARAHGYTGEMRDMPKAFARQVYRGSYWDAVKADQLPPAVRFHVFDAAVNSGATQSIKWLQQAANVTADGVLGPATLKACTFTPASALVARFNGLRLQFLTGLKTWSVFGAGWARRVAKNLLDVT